MRKSVEKAMEQILLAEWIEKRIEIMEIMSKDLCEKSVGERSDCGVPICASCPHQEACIVFMRALYQ